MPSFYDSISNTASDLITKFGKDITIRTVAGGTYNPSTGVESGATTTEQTVKAVVLPASGGKVQALDLRYKIGSMVFQKLNYFQISGKDLTFVPSPADEVDIGSETWVVIGVTPLNPNAGDAILYEVAIRV